MNRHGAEFLLLCQICYKSSPSALGIKLPSRSNAMSWSLSTGIEGKPASSFKWQSTLTLKHHRDIAAAFQAARSSATRSFSKRAGHGPDKARLVSHWLETSETANPPEPPTDLPSDEVDVDWSSDDDDDNDNEDTAESRARVRIYGDFISNEEAYQRLRARLCRHFLTTPAEPDVMAEIGQRVGDQLPRPQKVSRQASSMTYGAAFRVEWNPQSFLTQQGYEGDPGDAIANSPSFTGSTLEAQAVPCAQYLSEIWPLTGEVICQLIKEIVRDKHGVEKSGEFWRLSASHSTSDQVPSRVLRPHEALRSHGSIPTCGESLRDESFTGRYRTATGLAQLCLSCSNTKS